jgi:signal peptidase I
MVISTPDAISIPDTSSTTDTVVPAAGEPASGHASAPPDGLPPAPRSESRSTTQEPRVTRRLIEWALVIVLGLLVAVVLRAFVIQAFYIPSGSMEPTLMPQDRILVNKLSYMFHPPREGNIVVFTKPAGVLLPSNIHDLVKRVIGLPGQTIWSSDGQVYINGHRLAEPFLPPGTQTHSLHRQTIPPHEYFVMGDNRSNSEDSRVFGPIPGSSIVGQVVVRFWPLSRFKFF